MEENKTFTIEDIQNELNRVKKQKSLFSLTGFVLLLCVVGLVAIGLLIALKTPVLKINGDSMSPSLKDSDYVVAIKKDSYEKGDVIAFKYNDGVFVKRVIAVEGEEVYLDFEGNVYINDRLIKEDDTILKSLSPSDIEYPHTVCKDQFFVLGDNRVSSLDSRSQQIGDIKKEDIIGTLVFTIWPFKDIGVLH